MENGTEVPNKLKLELPYDSALPLLGIHPKNIERYIYIPMFTAALWTIAKIWHNLSVHWRMNNLWYVYAEWNIIQPEKERNLSICDNMEGPQGHYAKWNKSINQTEKDNDFMYVRNF